MSAHDRSESQLQLLLDSVGDHAIYMLDPNGCVMNWNVAAQRIKGYLLEEIEGRSFSQFFTPEDREAGVPQSLLRKAMSEGKAESEGWRVRKDGTQFWALAALHAIRDESGALIGFAKVTRDMTERRTAEQALMESERRFRYLVEGVIDYAIYMLDEDGIVSNWNRGAERIKGYQADEVVGQHFSIFYAPEDQAAGVPQRALQVARTEGRFEAEGWRVRKDGSRFWASVVIDAIADDEGSHIGFAKITRDITERRRAQIELQQAQERLAQSQKMEAIGQLTGGVAHDFNNLLMVVLGQAQLLRPRIGDDVRSIRALDAIEMAGRRGADLTQHLLSFARRQRLTPASVALSERAKALGDLISASLPSHISLVLDLPASIWPLEVDPGELDVALINLAINARDAMREAGQLTISAHNVTLKTGEIDELSGEFVAVTVADTGHGIPEDVLPKVFDPFFTTKAVGKGTGLGLSQVYGFVQQSGGHVTVTSELGSGARFTLYLPKADYAAQSLKIESSVEFHGGAHVLVVEDNPDVREVAVGLLEQLGNTVEIAINAEDALAVLALGSFDLVFSDVVMTGEMDGLALAREIRRRQPAMPIVLATGYSEHAQKAADEFPILRKPYQLTGLAHAIGVAMATPPDGDGSGAQNVVALDPAKRSTGRKSG